VTVMTAGSEGSGEAGEVCEEGGASLVNERQTQYDLVTRAGVSMGRERKECACMSFGSSIFNEQTAAYGNF
jgi:hypothetical protein